MQRVGKDVRQSSRLLRAEIDLAVLAGWLRLGTAWLRNRTVSPRRIAPLPAVMTTRGGAGIWRFIDQIDEVERVLAEPGRAPAAMQEFAKGRG